MSIHPRDILADMTPEELHLAYDYISKVLDANCISNNNFNCGLAEQTITYDDHQKGEARTILSEIELEALQRYDDAPNDEQIQSIIGKHAVRNFCIKSHLAREPLNLQPA